MPTAFRPADRDCLTELYLNHRTVTLAGAKHFTQENASGEILDERRIDDEVEVTDQTVGDVFGPRDGLG